ncbi:uncharacterized protein [Haliotis asinina]|uniref:uncharacterized protein isoform X2 n=1 Tax=Haliotis asinina TaxID=109174 RepID=UPI003532478D
MVLPYLEKADLVYTTREVKVDVCYTGREKGNFWISVEPGSPSQGHLTPGDIILAIGGRTSQGLTHAQAQNMIRGSGNALLLSLQRGGENFDHIKPKGPIKFAPWKHQQQH